MPEQRAEKGFYGFMNSDVSGEKKKKGKNSTHPEVLMY